MPRFYLRFDGDHHITGNSNGKERTSVDQAFRDLIEFETRCGHPPTDQPPGIPDERTQALRIRLITEEYVELTTALTEGNLPEIADGIVDLIYVCLGTAVRLGINLVPVWNVIHCANLEKFGRGSHREADGKISKPENWKHPDIAAFLASQRPLAETYGRTPEIDAKTFWDGKPTDNRDTIATPQHG
jgi:predicted HAD superfamily Cof-like phosphohydrolase